MITMITVTTQKMMTVMTNQAPNPRKIAQQIKTAGDQNERMLLRTIVTILASVGTLVGWMALAAKEPVTVAEAIIPEVIETPAPAAAEVVVLMPTASVAFAPIPTLRALPGRQAVPTLMPTQSNSDVAVAVVVDQSQPQPTAAPQLLRVVVPTAVALVADTSAPQAPNTPSQPQPTAAANQPAPQPTAVPVPKPKPTAAGHTKGSK